MRNDTKSIKILLLICMMTGFYHGQTIAQVTFLDSSIVTNDAFYFWKADVDKPYHYGASINPHGNCVKVSNGYVFYTWYKGGWDDRTLMVSRKKIGTGSWIHVSLPGKLSLVGGKGDTHLTTNIGICPIDSTIHIMYDHHNEDLNYIRSKKGVAFGPDEEFTVEGFLPQQDYLIPGKKVISVTYPDLFNNNNGDMMFERRTGSAVGGNIIMTYYDGEKWSPEVTLLQGTGPAVTQGERNFCYGSAHVANGNFYYTYSVRWAESPTILDEGVYLLNAGAKIDELATNVAGKAYNLPVIDHTPFFIADPRSVPDNAGWAGGPQVAISPKNDIYLNITPKGTSQYNYLKRAGETEFTEYRNKGALGKFYGNRMYKFVDSDGYLKVSSCLAGTYDWRTDYSMFVGSRFRKSVKIMDNGTIVAVYAEAKNSDKVPIHCFVFQIEKSEYTPQTITFEALPEKMEGSADFELNASASSKLPITYASSNTNVARIIDGNRVKIYGVGTCEITANQEGDGTFDSATAVSQMLTVRANSEKMNQTVDFSLSTTYFVWGSPDEVLNATATSGLPVQFESSDTNVAVINNGILHVKRAGKTVISALQLGDDTYNAAPIVGHELTVPKRQQVITFEAIPEKTSQDPEFKLIATSNNPNAKLRYVCPNNQVAVVWSDIVRQVLGTGSASITVSDKGDDYFTGAEATQVLVVKPKIHPIPSQIEAEYYTKKQGVNVTRWSNSVFYLNAWGTNDYAEYTIDVPTKGNYTVDVRAASPSAGRKLKLTSGSTTLANVTLTQSPNLTSFRTTTVPITLEAGIQNIRVVGVLGGYNLDWLKITAGGAGGGVDPDPGQDTVPAGNYTIELVDDEQVPNMATNLFDGKLSDDFRWSANGYPKSVVIDLGESKEIIGTRVYTYQNRAYQYTVEVSDSPTDGFVQVVDRTGNTSSDQPVLDDFDLQKGRYVRLTVTGCHAYASTWVSINEFVLVFNGDVSSSNQVKGNTNSVMLYPNPTHSSFKVLFNGINKAQVQIFNVSGQKVYDKYIFDETIELSKGVYLVKVMDENHRTYLEKLIVR